MEFYLQHRGRPITSAPLFCVTDSQAFLETHLRQYRAYLVSALAIFLSACATSGTRLPDEFRWDLFTGEAMYLHGRCPQYKEVDVVKAALGYCLMSKVADRKCGMAENFMRGMEAGSAAAAARYSSMPDAQVCQIAEELYGPNGSKQKNLLKR